MIPNEPAIPNIPNIPKPDVNEEPGFVLIPLHPGFGGLGGYGGYGGYGSQNGYGGYDGVQQPSLWSYFPINPYGWNLNFFTGKNDSHGY